jgi:AcrR family transcriptional regulator
MATTVKAPRQRVPAAERRDALIEAAVEEFSRTGLHGTPVDRIAKRVGVAQPYVFSLFPTKRDLFIAAVERGFERVTATFDEAVAAFDFANAADDEDAMTVIGGTYVEMLADDHALMMMQLQAYAACDDPVIRERVSEAYDRLAGHIGALVPPDRQAELTDFMSHGIWMTVRTAMGADPVALKTEMGELGLNGGPAGKRNC